MTDPRTKIPISAPVYRSSVGNVGIMDLYDPYRARVIGRHLYFRLIFE